MTAEDHVGGPGLMFMSRGLEFDCIFARTLGEAVQWSFTFCLNVLISEAAEAACAPLTSRTGSESQAVARTCEAHPLSYPCTCHT